MVQCVLCWLALFARGGCWEGDGNSHEQRRGRFGWLCCRIAELDTNTIAGLELNTFQSQARITSAHNPSPRLQKYWVGEAPWRYVPVQTIEAAYKASAMYANLEAELARPYAAVADSSHGADPERGEAGGGGGKAPPASPGSSGSGGSSADALQHSE